MSRVETATADGAGHSLRQHLVLSGDEAAELLRRLAEGLRRGAFEVTGGGSTLRLRSRGDLHVDLRFREAHGRGHLSIEISWWFVPPEGGL